MQVLPLVLFSLVGMGVVVAISAALYAALPRYFLECAERHGRFGGLGVTADSMGSRREHSNLITAEFPREVG